MAEDRTTKNRMASARAAAAGRAQIAHDVVALTNEAACIEIDLDAAGFVMVVEAAAVMPMPWSSLGRSSRLQVSMHNTAPRPRQSDGGRRVVAVPGDKYYAVIAK